MGTLHEQSNFSEAVLRGGDAGYQEEADRIAETYGFDFVGIGLSPFVGASMKWVYFSGATSQRVTRISLSPGHGIGGIVLKSGQPMMLTDIDQDLGQSEYSSYPIVFAEDLRSFCALPLKQGSHTVGVLILAHRSSGREHAQAYLRCANDLQGKFLDAEMQEQNFLDLGKLRANGKEGLEFTPLRQTELSKIVLAQEDERKRLSRELHDGMAQDLLTITLLLHMAQERIADNDANDLINQALGRIEALQTDIHNLSTELRPSTLDNFGLIPALKSQAAVLEKTYGANIVFTGQQTISRLDPAVETQVYRICQEAILNSCKYSKADKVEVSFAASVGWLNVTVSDKGVGFNTEEPVVQGSGCGLSGMRERARLIGADLRISSSDQGSTVSLVAPMKEPAKRKEPAR